MAKLKLEALSVYYLTLFNLFWFVNCQGNGWFRDSNSQTLFELNDSASNLLVQTKDGIVKGFTMKTITDRPIDAFLGLPYAQPPIGELRFRDPIKNSPWSGIWDATTRSPACLQMDLMSNNAVIGEEDCLYLSVYKPKHTNSIAHSGLPVMVYIHGGGWFFGSGSSFGPAYLLDRDVILVTVNFRLGPFGFLSTGDDASFGNQGLKDQVMALRWVHDNIAAFGGDPGSVTLFGQSAGGSAVQHLIVSPLSRGLFHKAISQSGSGFCYWAIMENSTNTARAVGRIHNCHGNSHEMVSCLRKINGKEFAAVQLQLFQWDVFPLIHFGPVVEYPHPGAFLTEKPEDAYRNGRVPPIPWITGFTTDEMVWTTSYMFQFPNLIADVDRDWDRVGPLLLDINYNSTEVSVKHVRDLRKFYNGDSEFSFRTRHALAQMVSDRFYMEGTLEAVRYHTRFTGAPTYTYKFTQEGKYSVVQLYGGNPRDWGVSHLDDLIYLLNNTDYYSTIQPTVDIKEYKMSCLLTSAWTNFATLGRPLIEQDGKLLDIWEPIQRSNSDFSPLQFLDLNLNPKMINDPYVVRYSFWRRLNLPD